MLDATIKLTGNEVEALLEQVRNRIEDNEFWAEESDEASGVNYVEEVAFWQAIEQKLISA